MGILDEFNARLAGEQLPESRKGSGLLSMLPTDEELQARHAQQLTSQHEQQLKAEQSREADPATCTLRFVRLPLATKLTHDEEGEGLYSMSDRLIYALGSDDDNEEADHKGSPGRKSFRCPGGCGGRFVFAMNMQNDEIECRCISGCSSETLSPILVEKIKEHEAQAVIDAQNMLAQQMRLNVSLARRLGSQQPLSWTIPKVISSDALTLLVGESGDGKTFYAMCLAIGVAAGVPVLGQPITQSRVLLVLLEGSEADWGRRLHQLAAGMGTTFEALDGWLDIYDQRPSADDPASYARLANYARDRNYKLIVIDNLTEIRAGSSQNAENSADEMSNAMRPLAELAHSEHVSVLLLHHAGASGNSRGSTAIRQMCDEELKIRKSNDANDAIVTISRGKSRRGDGVERIRYRMVDTNNEIGQRTMITPKLLGRHDEEALDGEEHHDEETTNLPGGDPQRARLLSFLPAPWSQLAKQMRQRTERTQKLRDEMVTEGLIEYKDGLWCTK